MFTLLVSCFLVACVPGLLMMAALGLGRLERGLGDRPVTAAAPGASVVHAETVDVHTLARGGVQEALEYLDQRQAQRLSGVASGGRHALPTHAAPLFAVDLPVSAGRASQHVKLR